MICTPPWRASSGIDLPPSSAGMLMVFSWAQAPFAQTRAIQATPQCSADLDTRKIIRFPPEMFRHLQWLFPHHVIGLAGIDERDSEFPIVSPAHGSSEPRRRLLPVVD